VVAEIPDMSGSSHLRPDVARWTESIRLLEIHGIQGVKAFVAAHRSAFPGAHSTVEDQVAEDDRVVTRWRARGTQARMRIAKRPTAPDDP
jgi:hypothetical protein